MADVKAMAQEIMDFGEGKMQIDSPRYEALVRCAEALDEYLNYREFTDAEEAEWAERAKSAWKQLKAAP